MRNHISIATAIALISALQPTSISAKTRESPLAQKCPHIILDVDKGRLNGISAIATKDEVKKALPCFTGESTEAVSANYGGGVFFLDNDFYFYTWRRFLEVRQNFKGEMTPALLGNSPEEVASRYKPLPCESQENSQTRPLWACDVNADNDIYNTEFYSMPWGCLSILFENNKAKTIRLFPELETDPSLQGGCTYLLKPV